MRRRRDPSHICKALRVDVSIDTPSLYIAIFIVSKLSLIVKNACGHPLYAPFTHNKAICDSVDLTRYITHLAHNKSTWGRHQLLTIIQSTNSNIP